MAWSIEGYLTAMEQAVTELLKSPASIETNSTGETDTTPETDPNTKIAVSE